MQKLWLRERRKGHRLSPALLAIAGALGFNLVGLWADLPKCYGSRTKDGAFWAHGPF
jgi:hypothetical protein